MSADNGIYVLRTKEGQHRVAYGQSIPNLHWDEKQGKNVLQPTSKQLYNYFKKSRFTYDKDVAFNIATQIAEREMVLEDGIYCVNVNKNWADILAEAKVVIGTGTGSIGRMGSVTAQATAATITNAKNVINHKTGLFEKATYVDGTQLEKINPDKKPQKNNTSGHTGVYRMRDKWVAKLTFKGKTYVSKRVSYEEAVRIRRNMERKYFGTYIETINMYFN
jgi:hypothetical protein